MSNVNNKENPLMRKTKKKLIELYENGISDYVLLKMKYDERGLAVTNMMDVQEENNALKKDLMDMKEVIEDDTLNKLKEEINSWKKMITDLKNK